MSSPKFALSKLLAGNTLKKIDSPRGVYESKVTSISQNPPPKFGGVKPKTEYNDEKISSMLENYHEVPKTEWNNLLIGTHIRYVKKGGEFKPGGFIRSKNSKGENSSFVLENDRFGNKMKNPDYTYWVMNFANVMKIYAKNIPEPSINQPLNQTQLPPINPVQSVEIGFLQKQLDDLEKKYSILETNYKNLQEKVADLELFSSKLGKYVTEKR